MIGESLTPDHHAGLADKLLGLLAALKNLQRKAPMQEAEMR
jgi:hypothetical protein